MQGPSSSWAEKHFDNVVTIIIVVVIIIIIILLSLSVFYYYYYYYLIATQVRQYLMEAKRKDLTRQAIINITEEAFWNLKSACSNTG